MMATTSTGVATSMWASNQHGRRRSRPTNRPSDFQTGSRPADAQAQRAVENVQPEDPATGPVTTSNDHGGHSLVPQNAASHPQPGATAMEPDAGSAENSDQIAVAEDAASSTQLDSTPAEPATAVNDDEDPIAAPQNAESSAQPETASPERTASSDDSGQSAGPQSAALNPEPDSAPPQPATTSSDNGVNHAAAQNAAQNTQTDSATPPVTASNNNISGNDVPRDPVTATLRVQRDPEEFAVHYITAKMASGASQSMWADEDTGQPDDGPAVNQEAQVGFEAQGQQPADANKNETGPSEIEPESVAPVVDEFHRAILPADDPRAGQERRLLDNIAILEELTAEDERFIAQNSGSKNKQMQLKVQTKQSGLMARLSALEGSRSKLLQLRQQSLDGPSKQAKQPQPSAGTNDAASDQPTVRPQESVNTDQDAKKSKGKEKQTDPSQEDDSAKSAATFMPGQESLWSDTNYVAPPKQKGKGKQKQQQQKNKNTASEASTTATAAASSALPHGNNPLPAQPQSGANNQASASTQPPTAAQTSANTPGPEQVQVPEGSQSSDDTGAATNHQSNSDDTAASTPHVNGNGPPGTGSSGTPNASGIPEGSSQPQSSDTNYRRVNTALIPDYTQSKKTQDAVQSLGQKPQVPKIQESLKDAKPFSWADEFDDTETFIPGPEIKQAEQAPQRQTPISVQDTSGNASRQPPPSKPEERSEATSSVQPPSKAEQTLMNQIQRLEKKHSIDQAIMQQCLSSGNVSNAKQLREQDIPYNEAGLLQLRANLEKINPQNPLLRPDHIESVLNPQPALKTCNDHTEQQSENDSAQAPGVQDQGSKKGLSDSIRSTDTPNHNVVQLPPQRPAASNDNAKQWSENASAQELDVEDELPTQSIADSRWANLPDVDLSARAPRKSAKNAGPSNRTAKGGGSSNAKTNANNSNGNGSGSSNGLGNKSKGNGNSLKGNDSSSSKGNGNNDSSKANGGNSSKGNGSNGSEGNGQNKKKKGNGKKK